MAPDGPAAVDGVADAALLALLGELLGLLEIDEFRHGLVRALQRALPSDWVSLNDVGPNPNDVYLVIEPPLDPAALETFARWAHTHPLIARYRETRDARPYRISDVATRADFHRTEIYRAFYEPLGIEYQVAFTLPASAERVLGVALSRCERDYSDGERALLDRARPYLVQMYLNAVEHERLHALAHETPDRSLRLAATLAGLGLTTREADVALWTATGRTTAAVGEQLAISPRTVQKHLERAYRKLGVNGRRELAERLRAHASPR